MDALRNKLLRKASGQGMVREIFNQGTEEGRSVRDTLLEMGDEGLIIIHARALGMIDYEITSEGEAEIS